MELDLERYPRLFDLSGRLAIVTGGAGWLGAPMSWGLARSGATVIVVGRSLERLEALSQKAAESGLAITAAQCDIRNADATSVLVGDLLSTHQKIDILVNNASAGIGGATGLDAPDEAFAEATEMHLTANWRLTKLAIPGLRAAVANTGDASVINIASMYGTVSPVPEVYARTGEPPNPAYYGAAKAGLQQMTRWLACQLGADSIRVNSVSPGAFPQGNVRNRSPKFVEQLAGCAPLGRIGMRHEIAGPVVFLASDASRFVTGADLAVDGGWTSW